MYHTTSFYDAPIKTVDFLEFERDDNGRRNNISTINLPREGTAYILHLKWSEATDPWDWKPVQFTGTRHLTDWVLVFHPDTVENAHSSPDFASSSALKGIFRQIYNYSRRKGTNLTLVGVERLHPYQFGGHKDSERGAETKDLILAAITNAKVTGANQQAPKPPNINFMTYDAWLATLGTKKQVEGVWPQGIRKYQCQDCPEVS